MLYPYPSEFDNKGKVLNLPEGDAASAAALEKVNPRMVSKMYLPQLKRYTQYTSKEIKKNKPK